MKARARRGAATRAVKPVPGPKVVRRGVAYSNPWFQVLTKDVVLAPLAAPQRYYMIRPEDYVVVLARTREGRVPLVRQYRPAVESMTLELPSGAIDAGEDPLAAGARELREETGYSARRVELLGALDPDTGRLANRLWCCVATGLRALPGWRPEEGVEVVLKDFRELPALVAGRRLRHAHDLAILSLAAAKARWPWQAAGKARVR